MTTANRIMYLRALPTQSQSPEEKRAASEMGRGLGRGGEGGAAEEGVEPLSIERPGNTFRQAPGAVAVESPQHFVYPSAAATVSLEALNSPTPTPPPHFPNYFWRKRTLFGQVSRLALFLSSPSSRLLHRHSLPVCLAGDAGGERSHEAAPTETAWPLPGGTPYNSSVCATR